MDATISKIELDKVGNFILPSQINAGNCPIHGDYTKNDCVNSGCRADGSICPLCFQIQRYERNKAEKKAKGECIILNSGLPPRFQSKTFETYQATNQEQKRLLKMMQFYADDFENALKAGRSMVLHGKTGTGKTHMACAIMQVVALKFQYQVRYTTAYHLVRDIKSSFSRKDISEAEIVRGFVDPDLLVIDETGMQFGSDTETLFLFEVLNGRYGHLRPTIVISNLEPKEIAEYLGDRVMDRLKENSGAEFAFTWDSYRK